VLDSVVGVDELGSSNAPDTSDAVSVAGCGAHDGRQGRGLGRTFR